MLKLTIPFTDEIVFNSDNYAEYQRDEVTVNQFDETRSTLDLSVKNLMVEDIAVFMIALTCPESVFVNVELSNYSWVMVFTLSGTFSVQESKARGAKLTMLENTYHSLLLSSSHQSELVIKGDVTLFVVCLTDETVRKLLVAEEKIVLQKKLNKSEFCFPSRLTTPRMNDLIKTIIIGAENKSLHRILLASKILELLFLDYEQLKRGKAATAPNLAKSNDVQKLEQARLYIGENLQAPCSLIELAHKVGLNDFKLKKGFKEVFGTTVFGYLADLRMEKAKIMLTSAQYTVSEVAHEVGYKNAHHFTAAFKKKYGKLPSKIMPVV